MQRQLLYYTSKVTGNSEMALDVLQDVWMKVFREIRSLRNPSSMRTWLYRIAHGIAVDRIRQNISRERMEESYVVGFSESEDVSFTYADAAAIHGALNELGLKHREVLVLFFLEELSLTEIAMVVGCSEGTIKSRLHYAKRMMKQILSGGGNETSR